MHAHITIESSDCDGNYTRTNVLLPEPEEDEWDFRATTIGNVTAYSTHGTLTFNEFGFDFDEPHEEGYHHTEVRWCDDEDADEKSTFRDHRAESMGY